MPVTGSTLLAELIGRTRFGAKARDPKNEESVQRARSINEAIAERTILPGVTLGKQQRISNFSFANDNLAQLLQGSGSLVDFSGRIEPIKDLGGILPANIDLKTLTGVEANLTRGNTREQREIASRRRGNILAGRDLDFVEPTPVVEKNFPEFDLKGKFGSLSNVKNLNTNDFLSFQQANPDLSDKELQEALEQSDTLIANLKTFARKAEFEGDPDAREHFGRIRDEVKGFLDELGFSREAGLALEQGSGRITDEPVTSPPLLGPTAQEGSSQAVQKALEPQIRTVENKISALKKGLQRATPEEKPNLESSLADEQEKLAQLQKTLRGSGPESTVDLKRGQKVFEDGVEQKTRREVREEAQETQPPPLPTPNQAANTSATSAGMQSAGKDPQTAEEIAGTSASSAYAEYDNQISEQERIYGIKMQGAKERDENRKAFFDEWENKFKDSFDRMQGIHESVRERSLDLLNKKERAAKEKLEWQEAEQRSEFRRNAIEEVMQKERDLALSGGFVSGQGMAEIRQVEREWKLELAELGRKNKWKRLDLANTFAQKRLDVDEKYLADSKANKDTLEAELFRISEQEFSSTETREKAEEEALTDWIKETARIRKEKKKAIDNDVKEMRENKYEKIELDREGREQALEELEWYMDTFGSNTPKSAIDSLQERLSDLNIQQIVSTGTSEEIQKAKSSTSVSDYSVFDSSFERQMTEDEYVNSKIAEMEQSMSISAQGRNDLKSQFKAEYQAKQSGEERLKPSAIEDMYLKKRAEGSFKTDAQAKEIRQEMEERINNGDLEGARRLIENVGLAATSDQERRFSKAMDSYRSLVDTKKRFEEIGLVGPIVGEARYLNLWDAEAQAFRNTLQIQVPGIARAMGEVGNLSESDIAIYSDAIAGLDVTVEQAMIQFDVLMNKIKYAIEAQLDTMDSTGRNTTGLRSQYRNLIGGPAPSSESPTQFNSTGDPNDDYINSLYR